MLGLLADPILAHFECFIEPNIVFLLADTKSIIQTHTFCTTVVNKNRLNRTFHNSVGGWITGVKRNFWLHAICACTE